MTLETTAAIPNLATQLSLGPAPEEVLAGEALAIPEAMRTVAPADPELERAHIIGALAAVQHRAENSYVPGRSSITVRGQKEKDEGEFGAKTLPRLAEPIVEHVRRAIPDVVIGNDRGGRPLALAVFKLWNKLYPDTPFPTIDHKLHFTRVSRSMYPGANAQAMTHLLYRSGVMAEHAARRAADDKRPIKVLLLDDWVGSGGTIKEVQMAIQGSGLPYNAVELSIGTMIGNRYYGATHIIGDKDLEDVPTWADSSNDIGVAYRDGRMEAYRSHHSDALRNELNKALDKQVRAPRWYRRAFLKLVNHL